MGFVCDVYCMGLGIIALCPIYELILAPFFGILWTKHTFLALSIECTSRATSHLGLTYFS